MKVVFGNALSNDSTMSMIQTIYILIHHFVSEIMLNKRDEFAAAFFSESRLLRNRRQLTIIPRLHG